MPLNHNLNKLHLFLWVKVTQSIKR